MRSLVVGLFLGIASLAVPILSSPAAAQGAFDRTTCLQGCAWLKPTDARGAYGQWMNYQNCVSDCEKRFWADFDDKTRDLERERDKD